MLKNGACCYYYSGGHPGISLKWASSSFLKIFVVGAVTMSAGRSFHMFTTLCLNVNLRRSSLVRSFFSFRECPRSLEEEVTPLNAFQGTVVNFIHQYHVSLVQMDQIYCNAPHLAITSICFIS